MQKINFYDSIYSTYKNEEILKVILNHVKKGQTILTIPINKRNPLSKYFSLINFMENTHALIQLY